METTHVTTPLHAGRPRKPIWAFFALHLIGLAFLGATSAFAANVDFRIRPRMAGKALLTEPGFVVTRELGVANFAPEMRMPVELVYKSTNEKSGAFGYAWRCPQLESAVKWSKDSLLWTTPWGEEIIFSHGVKETRSVYVFV